MIDSATFPLPAATTSHPLPFRPRLGFLGVGWIGRHRLEAIASSGLAEITAVVDPNTQAAQLAATDFAAAHGGSFEDLLDMDIDAVVIATPTAFHAEQAIAAFAAGKAVFCQKPLGRNAAETAKVVAAARRANKLLGVDFSYRHTAGMAAIRRLIRSGELGEIFAVEATFHNAYGPDKPWFYQRSSSGGGCLLDLGIHLVDLALWTLDFPAVDHAHALLRRQGQRLLHDSEDVEDYACGLIALQSGASIQLACSWRAPAGCDARIEISFLGTRGGASFHNINGSFFDFRAEHFLPDRSRRTLASGTDDWSGRAALEWVRQLAFSPGHLPEMAHTVDVARTLDLLSLCNR